MISTREDGSKPMRARRSLGRAALVGTVAVGLVAGGGGTAWAWWTATAPPVTASVSTDLNKPTMPSGVGCTKPPFSLPVRISFTAATTSPVPAGLAYTQSTVFTVKDAGGNTGGSYTRTESSGYQNISVSDVPGILIGAVTVWVQTKYTFADGSAPFYSDPVKQPVHALALDVLCN